MSKNRFLKATSTLTLQSFRLGGFQNVRLRKSPAPRAKATLYHTFHIITCRRVKYINYVIILMAQTVSQTAISRSWLACVSAQTEPDYQSPDTMWAVTGCCYGAIWITPLQGETLQSFPEWFITQRQVGLRRTSWTIFRFVLNISFCCCVHKRENEILYLY